MKTTVIMSETKNRPADELNAVGPNVKSNNPSSIGLPSQSHLIAALSRSRARQTALENENTSLKRKLRDAGRVADEHSALLTEAENLRKKVKDLIRERDRAQEDSTILQIKEANLIRQLESHKKSQGEGDCFKKSDMMGALAGEIVCYLENLKEKRSRIGPGFYLSKSEAADIASMIHEATDSLAQLLGGDTNVASRKALAKLTSLAGSFVNDILMDLAHLNGDKARGSPRESFKSSRESCKSAMSFKASSGFAGPKATAAAPVVDRPLTAPAVDHSIITPKSARRSWYSIGGFIS